MSESTTPRPDTARPDIPGPDPRRPAPDGPNPTLDTAPSGETIDLDRIERDLEGVESALQRLDDGTYWTDEVTGEAIADAVLAADPVARRAG